MNYVPQEFNLCVTRMDISSFTFGAALVAFLLLVRKFRCWIGERKYQQWARENGCGDVLVLPNILLGGLEHLLVRYSSKLDSQSFSFCPCMAVSS